MTRRLSLVVGAVALAAAVSAIGPARGAFPGDNGLIAYACGADICVVKADGTGGKVLVPTATDPAWSADGLKLAYVKIGVGLLVSTVDATGTITGTITTGAAATARHPAWSPSGLKIAYTNGGDIWTIDADTTGGAANLTQSVVGNDTDPAWSPSGTKIAYASDETGSSEIYTMSVDGSAQTRLTVNGVPDLQPDWSPDGAKLVFAQGAPLSRALWTVNPDGTGVLEARQPRRPRRRAGLVAERCANRLRGERRGRARGDLRRHERRRCRRRSDERGAGLAACRAGDRARDRRTGRTRAYR